VTFNWQGVTGGTGYTYTLEISRTADSGNIWSKSGITESSYTLTDSPTVTETLPPGTYYWRVKIVDDYGNEGAWSDSIEFTVSPIPTWVWVLVGLVVLVILMVVAYRETKFKVTE
jgi:amino acid transporter